jgi:hypothetical protein
MHQPGDQVKQSGLAAAGPADQRHDLTRGHLEIQPVQAVRHHPAIAVRPGFDLDVRTGGDGPRSGRVLHRIGCAANPQDAGVGGIRIARLGELGVMGHP